MASETKSDLVEELSSQSTKAELVELLGSRLRKDEISNAARRRERGDERGIERLGAAFLALHKRVDELYDELVGGEPEQQSLMRALG